MPFSFTINAKEYMRALKEYPQEIAPIARIAIKERLTEVQTRAAVVHRYTVRSGNLQKAFELIMLNDFSGELRLSKTISNAPYAFAIHEGRKDWHNYLPDRFLYNSFNHYEQKEPFRQICIKIVNEALRKARLI